MARAIGKAFRVSKKDVKGYGYAKPMTRNAGVTAIAAINGPGAYARARKHSRTARKAMAGLSRNERVRRARKVTRSDREAFERRMTSATLAKGADMRSNATRAQIAAARRNIKKAIAARRRGAGASRRKRNPRSASAASRSAKKGWRKRKRTGAPKRRSLRANKQTAAQRRASLANLRKARGAKRRKSGGTRRRRNPGTAAGRKRAAKLGWRRRKAAAPSSRRRRVGMKANTKSARSRAAKLGWRRRRSGGSKLRRNAWSNDAAGHRTAAKKGWRRKKKRSGRKKLRKNASPKQRAAARRNIKKAQAAWRGMQRGAGRPRRRKNARRRNPARSRAAKKGWRRKRGAGRTTGARKRYTGNARAFRKNQYMETLKAAFANGALITAGFAAHKAMTKVVCNLVCDRLFGAPASAEPAAVEGLEVLQPYRNTIAGLVTVALGIGITNVVVKDVRTKMMITGGMATSFLHTLLVTVLDRVSPQAAAALSGAEDAEAARLSAMYGLGQGTSILPEYAPIGEYFSEQVSGMGEYFSENVSGLGQYTQNPDLYQAAAGYGAVDNANSNHLDPSSDLDRELSIAEAAAGVGQAYQAAAGMGQVEPFEASAGVGEYFAEQVAGLGAIATLPTADTWIPGTSDGQLWAGVRPVSQPQASHAMTRAGILTSGGNQGVFG